jgi:hypothetical protein
VEVGDGLWYSSAINRLQHLQKCALNSVIQHHDKLRLMSLVTLVQYRTQSLDQGKMNVLSNSGVCIEHLYHPFQGLSPASACVLVTILHLCYLRHGQDSGPPLVPCAASIFSDFLQCRNEPAVSKGIWRRLKLLHFR